MFVRFYVVFVTCLCACDLRCAVAYMHAMCVLFERVCVYVYACALVCLIACFCIVFVFACLRYCVIACACSHVNACVFASWFDCTFVLAECMLLFD